MSDIESRLMSYLYYFNVRQDFFECHEYLESLWLDTARPQILQGLIQAAVCLYHLHNGNVRGATRMWGRAKPRLEAAFPAYESIDLVRLVDSIDNVFSLIPEAYKNNMATPQEIQGLKLPRVIVHFTDPDMDAKVRDWIPEPLPEED